MRFLDEYRSAEPIHRFAHHIRRRMTRPWTVMEVCGGQTHTILKAGLPQLLPEELRIIHGPGCPVCVTPVREIDRAIAISEIPGTVFSSFGDMIRVPGSKKDLATARAEGADVRIVYSPLDALNYARKHPEKQVVFFSVGFETTAPTTAMAVWQARERGLKNISFLVSHVLVPPAMETILSFSDNEVQGFLAAGHVCSVMGFHEYEPVAARHRVPIVVTGFEPLDLIQGLLMLVDALEEGRFAVENQYVRAVHREGNLPAQDLMKRVFTVCDREWRGLGTIPSSGFRLGPEFLSFDAALRFSLPEPTPEISGICIAGEILRGRKRPAECPAFASECTPAHPLGAPMVSSEGACAAYFQYGRH